jgi:hypothetical protein
MNGPFAATLIPDYRREIVWEGGPQTRSPQVLTSKHLALLGASKAWFARKFDETIDRDVLDRLASRISQPDRSNA